MSTFPRDGHMLFCCIIINIGNYFTDTDHAPAPAPATGIS
jgi:hypothetical protein